MLLNELDVLIISIEMNKTNKFKLPLNNDLNLYRMSISSMGKKTNINSNALRNLNK